MLYMPTLTSVAEIDGDLVTRKSEQSLYIHPNRLVCLSVRGRMNISKSQKYTCTLTLRIYYILTHRLYTSILRLVIEVSENKTAEQIKRESIIGKMHLYLSKKKKEKRRF